MFRKLLVWFVSRWKNKFFGVYVKEFRVEKFSNVIVTCYALVKQVFKAENHWNLLNTTFNVVKKIEITVDVQQTTWCCCQLMQNLVCTWSNRKKFLLSWLTASVRHYTGTLRTMRKCWTSIASTFIAYFAF